MINKMKLAATCLFLREDGKVLGCSRRNRPDLWGMPGGKVDEGETVREAARRETEEETGLFIKSMHPIYAGSCDDLYWTTCFLVTSWEGEPSQQEEGIFVEWKEWEDLIAGPFGNYNRIVQGIILNETEKSK